MLREEFLVILCLFLSLPLLPSPPPPNPARPFVTASDCVTFPLPFTVSLFSLSCDALCLFPSLSLPSPYSRILSHSFTTPVPSTFSGLPLPSRNSPPAQPALGWPGPVAPWAPLAQRQQVS